MAPSAHRRSTVHGYPRSTIARGHPRQVIWNLMGSFRVAVDVANPSGGRFERIEALVDTGATYTWIPRDVLQRLGVPSEEEWPFVLADGRQVTYPIGALRLRFAGRTRSTVTVFGEPDSEPLLGVVTLEELGLAADPVNRRLIPVPGLLKLA